LTQPTGPLDEYFAALARIKHGKPRIIPKGTRITNDAVSVEAGRNKGSIKKSRSIFSDLILAIGQASEEQAKPQNEHKERLEKVRGDANSLRRQLEAAQGREMSLLQELYETRKRLAELTGEKILPLRGRSGKTGLEV